MSMQPRADRADTRRRYTHQAYDTTFFGKSLESGPSGIAQRLEGTHRALITLTGSALITTPQLVGDLTAGMIITSFINHTPLSAGTLLTLTMPLYKGQAAVILTTGEPLTAAGAFPLDTPQWVPLPTDRPLTVTITAGTAQTFLISLEVAPILGGWF